MLTRQQKEELQQSFIDATLAKATTNLPEPTHVISKSND